MNIKKSMNSHKLYSFNKARDKNAIVALTIFPPSSPIPSVALCLID